jgi:hypothetical protein
MGTVSIWLRPPHETPVDRAIRERGERLRRAFPTIDFDNPGSRRSRPIRRNPSGIAKSRLPIALIE